MAATVATAAAAVAASEVAATLTAADNTAKIGDLVSRSQGDGKQNPCPSLQQFQGGRMQGGTTG